MTLLEITKKEYIEHPNSCPFCGSFKLDAGPFEIDEYDDDNKVTTKTTCTDCGETWRDVYKLVDIEEVDEE